MRPITRMAVVVCALSLCALVLVIKTRGKGASTAAEHAPLAAVGTEARPTHAATSTPRFVTPQPGHDDQPATAPSAPVREQTAEEERDQKIAWLKRTGPDSANTLVQASEIARAWDKLAQRIKARAAFGDWECYRGGCFGTAIHDTEATVDELSSEISQSVQFRDWNGSKMRSGPVSRPDGKVEITWVLFTADDKIAAAAPPG